VIGKFYHVVSEALGPVTAKILPGWEERKLRALSNDVQVSAYVARRTVNVLALERISNLMLAGDPELVQRPGGRLAWRVPINLTAPSHGRIGTVGELDVDAQHGEVLYGDTSLESLATAAQRLTDQMLHSTV